MAGEVEDKHEIVDFQKSSEKMIQEWGIDLLYQTLL